MRSIRNHLVGGALMVVIAACSDHDASRQANETVEPATEMSSTASEHIHLTDLVAHVGPEVSVTWSGPAPAGSGDSMRIVTMSGTINNPTELPIESPELICLSGPSDNVAIGMQTMAGVVPAGGQLSFEGVQLGGSPEDLMRCGVMRQLTPEETQRWLMREEVVEPPAGYVEARKEFQS